MEQARVEAMIIGVQDRIAQTLCFDRTSVPYGLVAVRDIKPPQHGEMHALAGNTQASWRIEARLQFDVSGEGDAFRRRGRRFGSRGVCRWPCLLRQGSAAGSKLARTDGEGNDPRRQQQPVPVPSSATDRHITSLCIQFAVAFMTSPGQTSCCSRGSPPVTLIRDVNANPTRETTPGRRLARRDDRCDSATISGSACFCRESTGVNFPSAASIAHCYTHNTTQMWQN